MACRRWTVAGLFLLPIAAAAQQQPQQPQQQQPPQPPQQQQQNLAWAQLPRMQLERQFAGPLQDTIVQRWRDPVDGTICYVYLPITAQHTPPAQGGFVQYGANTIGTISCMAPAVSPPQPAQKRAPAARSTSPNP